MTHGSNEARSVLGVLFRALAVGVGVLIAAVVLAGGGLGVSMNALLAALAMTACGAAIGFLFGIPKVLQGGPPEAPQPGDEARNGDQAEPARGAGTQYVVNTNLEQISDWLTKIIVGIGLIELRRADELFERLSALVVTGLTDVKGAQALAGSMLVYFGIAGFLTGYLATRLYLSGAFRRADAQLGGFALDAEQASRQQEELISELEGALTGEAPGDRPAKAGVPRAAASRSVLWVDDHPANNAALIDRMKKAGIAVSICQSTADALDYLEGSSFSTVITDLGRKEGMRYRREAGFDLIAAAREKGYDDVDFVIYTSPEEAAQRTKQAAEAGARLITGSPVELLRGVGLF